MEPVGHPVHVAAEQDGSGTVSFPDGGEVSRIPAKGLTGPVFGDGKARARSLAVRTSAMARSWPEAESIMTSSLNSSMISMVFLLVSRCYRILAIMVATTMESTVTEVNPEIT